MFLPVRELELGKIPFDVEIEPGNIEFTEDYVLKQASPAALKGVAELVSSTLGEIRVTGTLAVTMEAACDRCLEPARFPVNGDFDLYYRSAQSLKDEPGEKLIDEGEIEIGFYQGDGLQLEDILLEQIVLALPMQKVCKADCKGICPVCGQNRNLAACACQAKLVVESSMPVETHWAAALQSFKK